MARSAEVVPEDQPAEIEDEYRSALDAGIEDESALEELPSASFSITSFGADYTVDTIVSRLRTEAFFVPTFQRRFVWSQRHASRFIESLLMGLPVPGIFLYREAETGRHLVVDGQQRLRSLEYFYLGTFVEKKFRLVGVGPEWNGKTYSELTSVERLRLDDSLIHATIFKQDTPKSSSKSLYFVFERINSGGIRLSPQEIRNCISDGPLLDLIRELNDIEVWRRIVGPKQNKRLKDQELILRFVAMLNGATEYRRPMRDFLNDAAAPSAEMTDSQLQYLREKFLAAITICWEAKGSVAFRPNKALNAAVFEAVTLGVAQRLSPGRARPTAQRVAEAYDRLILDKEFRRACERATADEESVKVRQRLAIAAFSDI